MKTALIKKKTFNCVHFEHEKLKLLTLKSVCYINSPAHRFGVAFTFAHLARSVSRKLTVTYSQQTISYYKALSKWHITSLRKDTFVYVQMLAALEATGKLSST